MFGASVSNTIFSTATMYRGWVSSQLEYVFAGEGWINYAANQSHSEIRVHGGDASTAAGIYNTSDGSSSLKIVSAARDVLTLKENTGATITFNLLTNAFSY